MTDLVPVQLSGNKGVIITQFSLESIEEIGLVKIDLLGIRGLTVLGDVAGEIHSWQRNNYGSSLDVLEAIPEVDPEDIRYNPERPDYRLLPNRKPWHESYP